MWFQTIILTFLFFLISFGFGLFILAIASTSLIEATRLNRLQLIVLGFTIGGPGTGIFLQLLSLISTNLFFNLGLLSAISLAGFAATRNAWLPHRRDQKEIVLWAALSFPMALVTWWCSFGAFSHFPFGDLGADVHWMKIAQEYADTGIINSYANQSYIDLRSALAGALSRTLSLDLLQFDWVYRYFSGLYLMIVFYAVADSVFLDPYRKWFAFFFAAAGNTLGILSNGSIAVASSLVFLTVLPGVNARSKSQAIFCTSTLLTVGSIILSMLLAFFLNNNTLLLALLVVTALFLNVLNRSGVPAKNLAQKTFQGLVWPTALTLAHRGSYLFVPVVVAGWLLYMIVSRSFARAESSLVKILWILALALPLVCLCILTGVVAAYLGYLPPVSANSVFSYVTLLIVGRAIKDGDEISLGAGPEIAAIEMGRIIGPQFAVGIGLIFSWWCNTHRPARLTQLMRSPPEDENIIRLLWAWVTGCALCLAVLSGFPFLYRINFIILGIFTIATTEVFFQLLVDPLPDPLKQRRLVAAITAVATMILVVGVYAFGWLPHLPYAGYQAMLRPVEIGGLVLVLLFAALAFTRSRATQICGLAAAVSLAVAIDRSGIATLFKVYSFGRFPDRATTVSHYDASDLNTVRWLHNNRRNAIVISDPYTMGLAKAVAGTPGIYLFSNLDTVNKTMASYVKTVISAVVDPTDEKGQALRTCAVLSPLVANLNQEASVQIHTSDLARGVLKPVRPREIIPISPEIAGEKEAPLNSNEILRRLEVLNSANGGWTVVTIINPRTIQWLHLNDGQRLPYYPIDHPLKSEIVRKLQDGPFRVVFTDGQNAVIPIECTNETMHVGKTMHVGDKAP